MCSRYRVLLGATGRMSAREHEGSGAAAAPARTARGGKPNAKILAGRARRKRPSTSMAAVLQSMRQQLAPLQAGRTRLHHQIAQLSARRDELARQLQDIASRHATMVRRNADIAAANLQLKQQALACCVNEEQRQQLLRSFPQRPASFGNSQRSSVAGAGPSSSSSLCPPGVAALPFPPPPIVGQASWPAGDSFHDPSSSSIHSQMWPLQRSSSSSLCGPLPGASMQLSARPSPPELAPMQHASNAAAGTAAAGRFEYGAHGSPALWPSTGQGLALGSPGSSMGMVQPAHMGGPQELAIPWNSCPPQHQGGQRACKVEPPQQQEALQQQQQRMQEDSCFVAQEVVGGQQPMQTGLLAPESGCKMMQSAGCGSTPSPRVATTYDAAPLLPTQRSTSSSLTVEHLEVLDGHLRSLSKTRVGLPMAGQVSPALSDTMTPLLSAGCSSVEDMMVWGASSSCNNLSQLGAVPLQQVECQQPPQQQQQPRANWQEQGLMHSPLLATCPPATTPSTATGTPVCATAAAASCGEGGRTAAAVAGGVGAGMAAIPAAAEATADHHSGAEACRLALQAVPCDRYTALLHQPPQLPPAALRPHSGGSSSSCSDGSRGALPAWSRPLAAGHTAGIGGPWFHAPSMAYTQWHPQQAGMNLGRQGTSPSDGASAAAAAAAGRGRGLVGVGHQQQQAMPSLCQGPVGPPIAGGHHTPGAEPRGMQTTMGRAAPAAGAARDPPPNNSSSLAANSKGLCHPPPADLYRRSAGGTCLLPRAQAEEPPASSSAAQQQHQQCWQQLLAPPQSLALAAPGAQQEGVGRSAAVACVTHISERVTPAAAVPYHSSGGQGVAWAGGGSQQQAAGPDQTDVLQFLDDLVDMDMDDFAFLCGPADAA